MPNRTPEIDALVSQFVTDLDAYVKQAVAARVDGALDDMLRQVLGASVAKAAPTAKPAKAGAPAKAAVPTSGRKVRLCPVPGCGKPGAGPKYQWKCRDHGVLKSAKQPAAKAPTTAPTIALPKPKAPTVIPANVPITRLPPGPTPREKQSLSETAKLCRLPGCTNKHSGPRYDLFCRDHYATLNADERAKYKEMWKTQHAAA